MELIIFNVLKMCRNVVFRHIFLLDIYYKDEFVVPFASLLSEICANLTKIEKIQIILPKTLYFTWKSWYNYSCHVVKI